MKTIICFENEERSCSYNSGTLKEIRRLYPDNCLVMVSAGDFSAGGVLLTPSGRVRAEKYRESVADLVLSLPAAGALGGNGKKEFAEAALVQHLHVSEHLVIPCTPAEGQTAEDCRQILRSYAMLMFKEGSDYRRRLTEYLNQNMNLRKAQVLAICDCIPEAASVLSTPENRHALWLLDAMLQLYYMADTEFTAAPPANAPSNAFAKNEAASAAPSPANAPADEAAEDKTSAFDRRVVSELAALLSCGSAGTPEDNSATDPPKDNPAAEPPKDNPAANPPEDNSSTEPPKDNPATDPPKDNPATDLLMDISGSTSQMVAAIMAQKEKIRSGKTFAEIVQLLQPESEDRIRLFLLKAILGIRKINMQICGLHVYVPYCFVCAENPEKGDALKQLEEGSWVPFVRDPDRAQNVMKNYYYLLQADKKAGELVTGRT